MAAESTPLLYQVSCAEKQEETTTSPVGEHGSLATQLFQSFDNKKMDVDHKSSVDDNVQRHLGPLDAIAPLVAGGFIRSPISGGRTKAHSNWYVLPTVKSIPAFAPFRRTARHRSFTLWWMNEFRHWWKSRSVLLASSFIFSDNFYSVVLNPKRNHFAVAH
jgi:hypothetical protein